MKIGHSTPLTITIAYIPTSEHSVEVKEKLYKAIENYAENNNKRSMVIGGGFSARVQNKRHEEEIYVGNHTLYKQPTIIEEQNEKLQIVENYLLNFALEIIV